MAAVERLPGLAFVDRNVVAGLEACEVGHIWKRSERDRDGE